MTTPDDIAAERARLRGEQAEREHADAIRREQAKWQEMERSLESEPRALGQLLAAQDDQGWHEVTVEERNRRGKVTGTSVRAGWYLGEYRMPGSWHQRHVRRLYLLTDGEIVLASHMEPDDTLSVPPPPDPKGSILSNTWFYAQERKKTLNGELDRRLECAYQGLHKLRDKLERGEASVPAPAKIPTRMRYLIDAISEDDDQGVYLGEARLDNSAAIWHIYSDAGLIIGALFPVGPPDFSSPGGAKNWEAIEWQGANQVRVADAKPFGEAIDAVIWKFAPDGYTQLRLRPERNPGS